MNKDGLKKISYGLYLVSTKDSGCIINTVTQVTSTPKITIALNKENYTNQKLKEYQKFNITVLSEQTDMEVIKTFGFTSSKNTDKYQNFETALDSNNIKYLTKNMVSLIECEVENTVELDTHTLFIAKVIDTKILSSEKPMTYDYYHSVKKGQTPPKAPSYNETKKTGYRCTICGYIYEGDNLPEDFVCPICGAPSSVFEKIGM